MLFILALIGSSAPSAFLVYEVGGLGAGGVGGLSFFFLLPSSFYLHSAKSSSVCRQRDSASLACQPKPGRMEEEEEEEGEKSL